MAVRDESRLLLHPTSIPEAHLPVPTLLREMNPRTAYLIEMPGNHGDKLACIAATTILKRLGIRRTFDPRHSDAILLMGQGLMTDIWKSGILALQSLLRDYSDKLLIVMPSSFHFTETDFSSVFHGRRERCVLMARDTLSFDVLQSCTFPSAVELYCDHDPAFYLEHTAMMRRLRSIAAASSTDEVLIVERHDREHHVANQPIRSNVMPMMPSPMRLLLKTYFWAPKQTLRRMIAPAQRGYELSPQYRKECEQIIAEEIPWAKELPWIIGDLSNSRQYSFRQFCSLIARARAVLTSRLHVGILAAMLGKPTFLRAGNYGKIPGVYAMSMYDWPNVKLFGESGQIKH